MNPNINRFALGELFEWSMEAVLKTVEPKAPGVRLPHFPNRLYVVTDLRSGAREAEGVCLLSKSVNLAPRVRIPPTPILL